MKSLYLKRCLVAFSLLAVLGIVVACQKEDDTSGLIEVIAEPMNGAKVLVNGSTGSWVDGDAIRINDEVATVQHSNGSAYISATSQSVNRAVYPASLYDGSLTSDAVTLSFPKIYHYRTDDSGHQLLEFPMAACSQSGHQLKFYHLTGALCFTITDTASKPLRLQSITLSSNEYQLSGSRTINFNNLTANTTSNYSEHSVMMVFDTGYVLPAGETIRVMIPVLPVGNDNVFTVKIRSYDDAAEKVYQYSNTQSTGGYLNRNQLGYVPVKVGVTAPQSLFESAAGSDRFLINTAFDFKLMAKAFRERLILNNTKFRIAENIDMTGMEILPIEDFRGEIDGDNHVVSNLTIKSDTNSEREYCCALIENVFGGSVSNLTLSNLILKHTTSIPTTGYLIMGGIYAKSTGDISLSNCNVNFGAINISGSIEGYLYFGGIIGEASSTITINNCHVTTDFFSSSTSSMLYWGGIIGRSLEQVVTTINNSSWHGSSMSIDAARRVTLGGFVGYKAEGSLFVSDCNVEGSVTAEVPTNKYYYLGSVVGQYYRVGENSIDSTRSLSANIKATARDNYTEISLPDYNYSLKRDNNP